MCQFIETIRIENGQINNLPYHQKRLEKTCSHFWPGGKIISLENELSDVPKVSGIFKARLVYQKDGVVDKSYFPYSIRQIRSLQLVESDYIDYTFKSTDRKALVELTGKQNGADEIIIVKNGLLTDTSYSNIAFHDGEKWFTPSNPLLEGTMRQSLIDQQILTPLEIHPEDIGNFKMVALINAMMPLGRCVVPIERVYPLR